MSSTTTPCIIEGLRGRRWSEKADDSVLGAVYLVVLPRPERAFLPGDDSLSIRRNDSRQRQILVTHVWVCQANWWYGEYENSGFFLTQHSSFFVLKFVHFGYSGRLNLWNHRLSFWRNREKVGPKNAEALSLGLGTHARDDKKRKCSSA